MSKVKAKKNTFDTILNVFAWLSFFVAVILALAVFLSSYSGTENGKTIFGYKMLIVESDSMSKSALSKNERVYFNKGDLIFIKEVSDVSKIAVGDVITFVSYNPSSKGKTISHKVRSIKTRADGEILGFETYGIYTGVSDQVVVDPSTIIGKYVGKSEGLGKLFCYMKTPAGYFTSILIPCVLLIIFFSVGLGKILTQRGMHRAYYSEFEKLRERINELEKNKEGVLMQTDLQMPESSGVPTSEHTQQPSVEQPFVNTQPVVQVQNNNDKVLEIMANSLNNAVNSLTHIIDTLATVVGKPVDSLTRSIEVLAAANSRHTTIERIIEKPVAQNIIKDNIVAPTIKDNVVEPVKEQALEEVTLTEVSAEKEEQAPIVQSQEVKEENTTGSLFSEFAQHEKVAFNKKLLSLDKDVKEYFSEIHNELVSFKKVNYRISFKGITYRVGRKALAKMVVRGKTLKLHLALNVEDFSRTVFFQQDMGNVKAYEDVPFTVKIKSDRAKKNALKLVNSLAENNLLKKDEQFTKENILKELRLLK